MKNKVQIWAAAAVLVMIVMVFCSAGRCDTPAPNAANIKRGAQSPSPAAKASATPSATPAATKPAKKQVAVKTVVTSKQPPARTTAPAPAATPASPAANLPPGTDGSWEQWQKRLVDVKATAHKDGSTWFVDTVKGGGPEYVAVIEWRLNHNGGWVENGNVHLDVAAIKPTDRQVAAEHQGYHVRKALVQFRDWTTNEIKGVKDALSNGFADVNKRLEAVEKSLGDRVSAIESSIAGLGWMPDAIRTNTAWIWFIGLLSLLGLLGLALHFTPFRTRVEKRCKWIS